MASQPLNPSAKWTPLWVLGAMVALLGFARAVAFWHLPLPRCTMRLLTGWPCPFCGSTRALIKVSYLDLGAAFLLNPLTFLLGTGLVGWTALWGFERITGRPILARVWLRMQSKWLAWAALGLLVANWLYLVRTLPP